MNVRFFTDENGRVLQRIVLEAIANGLDGKIMRVGNLMARHSDGEFQINFRSSGFMRQLRGYKMLRAFPMSMMYAPVEFSEIGMVAEAILRLSGTGSKFTVFHPYNNHMVTMADVIYIMQQYGFEIDVVSDQHFRQLLNREALFRLGFKWPITSPEYLRKMIAALDGLGMF